MEQEPGAPCVRIETRHIAWLSGLDKDSIRVALAGSVGEGSRKVEQRRGEDQVIPRLYVAARPGRPVRTAGRAVRAVPGELAYGVFREAVPDEAAGHLAFAAALSAKADARLERISFVERRVLGIEGRLA
jgi:hypothetical protein